MSSPAIPKALRLLVFERDGGRCAYCRVLQIGQSAIFHVDHIRPRAKGGRTVEDNLALQCPHCSLRKSDKIDAADPQSGAVVRLFHPRTDAWNDHFRMGADGTIEGRRDMGRATVVALAMNDIWPRSARELQLSAGWMTGLA
jgi:hypothetical protein